MSDDEYEDRADLIRSSVEYQPPAWDEDGPIRPGWYWYVTLDGELVDDGCEQDRRDAERAVEAAERQAKRIVLA